MEPQQKCRLGTISNIKLLGEFNPVLKLTLQSIYGPTLTAVSGVGSSPALATCETSQVLLAGVSGGFSRGSPVFAPPTDWSVSYELK